MISSEGLLSRSGTLCSPHKCSASRSLQTLLSPIESSPLTASSCLTSCMERHLNGVKEFLFSPCRDLDCLLPTCMVSGCSRLSLSFFLLSSLFPGCLHLLFFMPRRLLHMICFQTIEKCLCECSWFYSHVSQHLEY